MDPELVQGFREDVQMKARHLDEEAIEKAVRYHVEVAGRVGLAYVAQCVQLAGMFAEQAGASPSPSPSRHPGDLHVGTEWIRLLSGRINAEREAIWSTPEPPWAPSDWEEAVLWLRIEEDRGREALTALESSEEWRALKEGVERGVSALGQMAGEKVTLQRPRHWIRLLQRFGEEWRAVFVEAFGSRPLRQLSIAAREIQEAAGFIDHEVSAWILFGIPPEFRPTSVELRHVSIRVPGWAEVFVDGTPQWTPTHGTIPGKRVEVTLRSPYLTPDDYSALREEVRALWWSGADEEPEESRARFTPTDRAFDRAWRDVGGPLRPRGKELWEDVRERWLALSASDPSFPEPPQSVASVRRYFYRVKEKKGSLLDHAPKIQKKEVDDA
ncbi:MAG: hypothetical protein WEG36_12900 [Gemmatimonadota bacterium]